MITVTLQIFYVQRLNTMEALEASHTRNARLLIHIKAVGKKELGGDMILQGCEKNEQHEMRPTLCRLCLF